MTDYTENFIGVKLTWDDQNDFEDGFRVYRSASPFGEGDLPPILATLPPNTTEYTDTTVLAGYNYHYRVSTFSGGTEVFATSLVTANTKLVPDTIGEYFRGGYYIGNITIPVGSENEGTYAIVMAESDGQAPTTLSWKTSNTDTPGATSLVDGVANMDAMALAGLSLHPAAEYCDSFVSDVYSDWYLPSKDELNLAWVNRAAIAGALNFTGSEYYWSSTQYSATNAWRQRFSDGGQYNYYKSNAYRVRPVRRLKLI